MAPCGAHDSEWELDPWAGSSYDDILEAVVSAEHPVFGVPLRSALMEATSSLGLRVGTAAIRINAGGQMVSAWVFSW